MHLPPYAYVPGHWPHPTRDPAGHAHALEVGEAAPLDGGDWASSPEWIEGVELFDHGYYWEAHEVWERLWIAAGRTGPTGALLGALIKLAAAGLKIRQGNTDAAVRLGERAAAGFEAAHAMCGAPRLAGLSFVHLHAMADEVSADAAPQLPSTADETVATVFARTLWDDLHRVDPAPQSVKRAVAYHLRTKHLPGRFAASLGHMDWATQPDPFLRHEGAPLVQLAFTPLDEGPRYEPAFVRGALASADVSPATIGRLFEDSLALSAWKQVGETRWPLRVNPSSGNLHPTEGYLIAGAETGLADAPALYHYAPREHALEVRGELDPSAWARLRAQLPADAMLVGLTSIHWREAWKYGERAFRYCQHDLGHAIACISIAAAGLGWDVRVLEELVDDDVAMLLGIEGRTGPEAEHPGCILAVFPGRDDGLARVSVDDADRAAWRETNWRGEPRPLSDSHHAWPVIGEVAIATRKRQPPRPAFWDASRAADGSLPVGDSAFGLRGILHQRRSAVELDGHTGITRDAFHQILLKTLPIPDQIPFTALPWRPSVDLLLFVHRVQDVAPGLYALVRDDRRLPALRAAMTSSFAWTRDDACPRALGLYLLDRGDARHVAAQVSCGQSIAGDGAFAVAMLADFADSLRLYGPSFYRRLFWETGVIGQVLYLEAEASGIRGTGIGCFFDDLTHGTFGLEGRALQVLYHFTMGGPVDDPRLRTHAPYGDP